MLYFSGTPLIELGGANLIGQPTEIVEVENTDLEADPVYRLFMYDRLTQDRTLVAESKSPIALSEYGLERGSSSVEHKYDIRAYQRRKEGR